MSARTDEPYLSHHIQEGGPWCLIESDPGVFTDLLKGLGVKGVQATDVYWALDDKECWDRVGEVYGLVFLFKVEAEIDKSGEEFDDDEELQQVYFANQVIDNACATQAILNIVLNCDQLNIGEELRNFKEFTRDFKPPLKGLAMTNTESFRRNHNSFVRYPEDMQLQKDRKTMVDEDQLESVYHYTGYVSVNGAVFELDGLARNPRKIGPIDGFDWIEVARASVAEKMNTFLGDDIEFTLMAVVKDQVLVRQEKVNERIVIKNAIDECLQNLDPNWRANYIINGQQKYDDFTISSEEAEVFRSKTKISKEIEDINSINDITVLLQLRNHAISQIQEQFERLRAEKERSEEIAENNIRRKHNYIPFITEFIKILDERGELGELLASSDEETEDERERNEKENNNIGDEG